MGGELHMSSVSSNSLKVSTSFKMASSVGHRLQKLKATYSVFCSQKLKLSALLQVGEIHVAAVTDVIHHLKLYVCAQFFQA